MNGRRTTGWIAAVTWATLALSSAAWAQALPAHQERFTDLVVPQNGAFVTSGAGRPILVESVEARVRIVDQTATTTLQVSLRNPSTRRSEAVLLLPVPDGAVVSSFLFDGPATEPTAKILPEAEARATYDRIVARVRDPALLEFAGYRLIRSSVFPLEPKGAQKVRVTYEHLLERDGPRLDYVLPRSESLAVEIPWRIAVDLKMKAPVSTVFSPTHELETRRFGPDRVSVRVKNGDGPEPGPFRLAVLEEGNGVSATLFAYPSPDVGGGYFLLLAGLPSGAAEAVRTRPREVTLVIDRSGSMAGKKLDQVRRAAIRLVESLEPGEAFNILDYATTVSRFSHAPVERTPATVARARAYLERLAPGGGTNVHDALVEALRQPTERGRFPIVLFLTDGIPTVGSTSEAAIRQAVERGNPHARRVFTLGVGTDVNAPLLDRIAEITRATSRYVLPGENIEPVIARVARQFHGPVLADPALATVDSWGSPDAGRIAERLPVNLPDLFQGDRLVVLGQYRGSDPLTFKLTGEFLGRARSFRFTFDLDSATTRNAFVPRLWAGRQIAYLVDQVRQLAGEDVRPGEGPTDDPRVNELVDEILRLSTRFGILSEYSAFLAMEGTDLSDWETLRGSFRTRIDDRAIRTRTGAGAVNQSLNISGGKLQSKIDYRNRYVDENLRQAEVGNVQQIADRAFFRQNGRWVDTRLVGASGAGRSPVEVSFGSPEHRRLLTRLAADGRQGALSLPGEILVKIDGRTFLIRNTDRSDGAVPSQTFGGKQGGSR